MSIEQLLRRFWPVLLIVFIFVWKNLQRKAKLRASRRRSLAKARRAKAQAVRSARPRKRATSNPARRRKISKKEFLERMAKGRRKAALARKRALK